ncbi:uncharacterized protein LOC132870181 [Neoarius graeffei]|uniref:uncharacterized protein LOC132870181 n=1 Tax=Neoarius graeffei TaxID=443677 RepID=UPI00298D47C7|nr:uncharacterized protein LOC132870181 [Neoarius graeffei]XP_060759751.1 uncharacterized protein LOC132870181 [Neoarius graeffei]
MRKSCPELLREAASLIEEALRCPPAVSGTSSHDPAAAPRTPVQAEVARLLAPYARTSMARRPGVQATPRRNYSYTHMFCCVADHRTDTVPSGGVKADLLAAGLGEQRVTFSGNPSDPMVITNKLMEVYPKLQEGGGFELLKITGPTRSRSLALLPCPSTGYTLAFLKDPSTMIGQATLYIRPLQQDLPLDCERPCHTSGPAIPCITCQKEVIFSEMKCHRLTCNEAPVQDSERDQEGGPKEDNGETPVSDDVEVPGPSVENAVKPVVIDLEECDYNETDNDWKLIKEPARAAKVFKENLLREHANGETLKMKMDVRDSEEEREQQLLSFYKQQQKWACPLNCTLAGDAAVGEGVMRFFMTTIISKLQFGFSLGEE